MKLQANETTPRGGFTLIELLVVIAIISLLSSIVLTSLGQARSKARDSKRVQDMIQLRNALELYALDNNGLYPPDPVTTFPEGYLSGDSCWDCLFVHRDANRLLALSPYINPRPADPQAPFANPTEQLYWGYRYKVSESRKHYKLTIIGSVENKNNVPKSMYDPNHWDAYPNSISVYSDDISKDWGLGWEVDCAAMLDC